MKYVHEIQYLIRNNRFEHYYLYENVLNAYYNELGINAKWKIGEPESWILGFCSNNNYNIYGLNFSKELLEEVNNNMDFDVLPNNLCFSGNKEIIDFLFKKRPDLNYEIYKERYFYEITSKEFSPKVVSSNIKIRKANTDDLEILAKYNCLFFEEEYDGQNNKEFEQMKTDMETQINDGQYLVAEINNSIAGFCSHFETKFDNEMIGTVFVHKDYRSQKIGFFLIQEMTKLVLSKNKKCWLMTDIESDESNKIMEKIGYRKIYEYTSGVMKKL